jgi:hypothetical protein
MAQAAINLHRDDVWPHRWMTLALFCERYGYTKDAFDKKRSRGIWLEDQHWHKAPDSKIMIDWRAIEEWIEGKQ